MLVKGAAWRWAHPRSLALLLLARLGLQNERLLLLELLYQLLLEGPLLGDARILPRGTRKTLVPAAQIPQTPCDQPLLYTRCEVHCVSLFH